MSLTETEAPAAIFAQSGAALSPDQRVVDLLADLIGSTSLALGLGLTLAPKKVGSLLGLDGTPPARARLIGVADVGLGSAILTSSRIWPRRRWPALMALEGLHLVIASEYARHCRTPAALAMIGLFIVDGVVTVMMHRQERR